MHGADLTNQRREMSDVIADYAMRLDHSNIITIFTKVAGGPLASHPSSVHGASVNRLR